MSREISLVEKIRFILNYHTQIYKLNLSTAVCDYWNNSNSTSQILRIFFLKINSGATCFFQIKKLILTNVQIYILKSCFF